MATIILQAAGAFLGGFLGPIGATLGTAAGAVAGYVIDRALLSNTQHYEGPRLAAARPFSGEEGVPLPRIYGTVRIGGTIIWATRFEETSTTSRQGGKGGPKSTTYSYFANAAFALCEGEIAGVRRIWADGREIDRSKVEIRVYAGSENQPPDPLIEAKQGSGNAPAYRGTAYVVVDRLPIDDYGRRLPQLQFEVLRPVGRLNKNIRSVALIPGSTEYGLSPSPVTITHRPGEEIIVNRHTLAAASDFEASLDELQMLLPNLRTVSLVVSWFGTDLRAGHCQIRPMVTRPPAALLPNDWRFIWQTLGFPEEIIAGWLGPVAKEDWLVSGVARAEAQVVSHTQAGAAYGGTPSDRSVMDAIDAIKKRGLNVWLYPFVMMDIPADNTLVDPYGEARQAAYPWRGRVTCHPAPGRPGSSDKSSSARAQVETLLGGAALSDFAPSTETVDFNGAEGDWGYRRFLLHYARLAAHAGGVDGFLVGSELRGLTCLRDEAGQFPFVEALRQIAGEARAILGSSTTITYGADWTEYFGHQPADGSGDVLFHLDALWADDAIDAVGIDNYMPLSDWRDEDHAGDNPDGFCRPYDPVGLRAGIVSGEGFDWYYASTGDRQARLRTPITDGAYGKTWTFRYKDIAGWWSNPHVNRINGIETGPQTPWVPRSKPVIFTELGCAAIDKAPNQPNVFSDAKSAENATPYFSNGSRSDLAQHRFLSAHFEHWAEIGAANPLSNVYGGSMVEPDDISVWAWDARPFPVFPLRSDIWGDGENWSRGHWLNGRSSGLTVSELIDAILADHGLPPADTARTDGTVSGYVVASPGTARDAIEPIAELFGIGAWEEAGALVFSSTGVSTAQPLQITDLSVENGRPAMEKVRDPDHGLAAELHVDFRDQMKEHQSATVLAAHAGAKGRRKGFMSFPGVLSSAEATVRANAVLHSRWAAREQVTFSLPMTEIAARPGTLVRLPGETNGPDYIVTDVEDGLQRTLKARRVNRVPLLASNNENPVPPQTSDWAGGMPFALLLDLPWQSSTRSAEEEFRVAARARPWRRHVALTSLDESGFEPRSTLERRATMGFLKEPIGGGLEGRIDLGRELIVELLDGALRSVSPVHLLNGANVAALYSASGAWEILQFQSAEEIGPSLWRLTGLLRGQLGTNDAMQAGSQAGAIFVLLDEAVRPVGLAASEIGLPRAWRIGPAGDELGGAHFLALTGTGGLRSQMPLSPVHLRARRIADGALALSWVRRGRIDADNWQAEDVPLGETNERYRIDIAPEGGAIVRTQIVSTPSWTYSPASIAADFPSPPAILEFTVRQISTTVGAGIPARRAVTL
ncbi:baseplate multidomain protein megatron [Nitratireductor soli]|uniref:baseplate multidomain protein megatron n=1 Tax=Nitratireductor soli TaxID=1670619 RepID=UPI00065DF4EB|nr:glycoside hydrolase/phage tail family protein [Nitratireductor soli]